MKTEEKIDAVVNAITETLIAKCRKAIRTGGNDARRQIVRTSIQLERLLGEGVK